MNESSVKMATVAARSADEKLATNIAVLDVTQPLTITDLFVIASAETERQVQAIVDEIEFKMKEAGYKPAKREGVRESRWSLLDYTDIVVHVMREEEREFYGLDRLYADCPIVNIEGIEPYVRPVKWDEDVDVRAVNSLDEIPLAAPEPDRDEL
ncbi:ribosome silencing factor [Corynebacterium pyruviciproducens]|uniref:ribosome silencing factor n=1 Tax=Corynebacterium pyruviciproducens TaxID=598660 RepID=UPI003D6FC891